MLAHCRGCGRRTPTFRSGSFNGTGPLIELFRCRSCGHERMQMGDPGRGGVPDADGLCYAVVDGWLRATGNARDSIDYDDALGHLRMRCWASWAKYDPGRGVPFLAYATGMLRFALSTWVRDTLGRSADRPKAHVGALPLHEHVLDPGGAEQGSLEAFDGRGGGDPADDCSPDLEWVLARGGSRAAGPV